MIIICNQGKNKWNLCYHSINYPDVAFVHLDNISESPRNEIRESSLREEDNAKSPTLGSKVETTASQRNDCMPNISILLSPKTSTPKVPAKHHLVVPSIVLHDIELENSPLGRNSECREHKTKEFSYSVGHISHIPRTPPSPSTYTIPSVINYTSATKSVEVTCPDDGLFGMIALKENDVCYTSGTIEWVGKKRNYPINSGFKLIKESTKLKRMRKFDVSVDIEVEKADKGNYNCNCADVLPTVNAIIDHLNALHEAVDLVDLRLNNLEGPLINK